MIQKNESPAPAATRNGAEFIDQAYLNVDFTSRHRGSKLIRCAHTNEAPRTHPDGPIIPDRPGRHRLACPQCDRGPGDRALSALVEPDGSRVWLCWRCGWSGGTRGTSRSPTDMERQRRERKAAEARRHAQAAQRAQQLWRKARPADPSHQYLADKAVTPGHARQLGALLVLPIVSLDGELHSLQFIDPQGGKRMLGGGRKQGCAIPAGGQRGADRILVAEGWATARTLSHMEPDDQVLAALDAGNLGSVAMECRRRWPEATIVVCGDADDVGRRKACEAALAARALVAIPDIDPALGTDFNDLATAGKGAA